MHEPPQSAPFDLGLAEARSENRTTRLPGRPTPEPERATAVAVTTAPPSQRSKVAGLSPAAAAAAAREHDKKLLLFAGAAIIVIAVATAVASVAIIVNAQREMNRRGGRKVQYHLKASDLKPLGHLQEAAIARSNYNFLPAAVPRPVTNTAKKMAAPGRPKDKKSASAKKAKKASKPKPRRPTTRRKPAKPAKRAAKKRARKTTPMPAEEEEGKEEGED